MYAVIATGGKQYRVKVGEVLHVEKLNVEEGDVVTFDQVLMLGGDDVKVGNPTVAGATVKAKVLANEKGKKVIVYKYKPKKGFHKKRGHRQQYTKVKIESIEA